MSSPNAVDRLAFKLNNTSLIDEIINTDVAAPDPPMLIAPFIFPERGSVSRFLAASLLAIISSGAIYFIIVAGFLNGFMGLAESWQSKHSNLLPYSTPEHPVLFRQSYSGIKPLDMLISRLTPFFWPLINGQKPELTLFGLYMFGQICASETLLIVEGWRIGNMDKAISYSTIWGLTLQNLPWGFVQPLYSVFHLLTSPVARSPAAPSAAMSSVDPVVLSELPFALAMGYGFPSILMCLPAPRIISHDKKQIFLFIWQLFPLWIGLIHYGAIQMSRRFLSSKTTSPLKNITQSRAATLRGLRLTYLAAIAIAAITHLGTIFLVIFNRQLVPYLPAVLVAADPIAVFRLWPAVPNLAHYGKIPQVADIAEGFLVLLQYDTVFAGLGVLVWAMWLRSRVGGRGSGLRVVGSAIWQTALLGPCGAAVGQMWMRDEVVFDRAPAGQKKE